MKQENNNRYAERQKEWEMISNQLEKNRHVETRDWQSSTVSRSTFNGGTSGKKSIYKGRYKTILGKDSEVDEIKRFSKIDI